MVTFQVSGNSQLITPLDALQSLGDALTDLQVQAWWTDASDDH